MQKLNYLDPLYWNYRMEGKLSQEKVNMRIVGKEGKGMSECSIKFLKYNLKKGGAYGTKNTSTK